ncbi:carboxypeptidase-like regulatory domain-containing protein [Dyadobacter pollutisoli]|uniref:Carboxypeptidase-like regulatory domain-containing protein n=1 Tax=Dyadobacter pollutisoli TaxID=2910158 RepID=A0A9E8SLF6_9BACT|nr:carboxypeptidase-like regulatory domain-containing protein [Dyadobacter pollutisoli]WAC12194.1 carboxypeptidase-like regulatory domain-containing protein [Dyadobacter pollutisoli]
MILSIASNVSAQDLLEKRISIRVTNQPLDETLQKIGDLGDFSFSYSPDMIDIKSKVSIQAINQSVREILIEIFKDKVTFKERRKYIILQKNTDYDKPEKPENFNLNGYIIDNKTGRKLANASIYESVTLASAVSNRYGYYKIRLPTAPAAIRLEIRKEDYIGKTIAIPNRQDTYLQITLTPDTLKPISGKLVAQTKSKVDSLHHKVEIPQFSAASAPAPFADTIRPEVAMNRGPDRTTVEYDKFKNTYRKVQNRFVSAFASASQAIHTRNIEDTLHRPFQASILPFLGTNHQLSGNIVNDYSINLIAGYSLGVNKLEVGSIFNVVRGNVRGFQLAGVGNIVGKDVVGFQYANFLNLTLGNFTGFQGTNFINYTGKNFRGFQVAGVGNVVVGVLDGYQFSAGYNYAHTVRKGHQIGFVNYSDSSAHVPFGLFSFVQTNGYRRYEFSSDELNYFNTAFKTGVSRFYNIFSLGFNGFLSNKPLLSLGYGFGTAQKLGRGWMVNADATLSVVVLKNQKIEDINIGMLKIALGIEKKIGNQFALFAGPTLNLLGGEDSGFFKSSETKGIRPIWIGEKPTASTKEYTWLGFQAGIRFCNLTR